VEIFVVVVAVVDENFAGEPKDAVGTVTVIVILLWEEESIVFDFGFYVVVASQE
jgi:hypothetical protein